METGNLTYRVSLKDAAKLLELFTRDDSLWRAEELKEISILAYIEGYKEGEWRIWEKNNEIVAITYHLEVAPSNQKPWLGTVVVNPYYRRKGVGIKVVEELKKELHSREHKALFAGVPVHASSWIQFLSDCYFEQFKVEKDEQDYMYLIMVSPLQ